MTRLTLKRVATSLLTGGMIAALAVVATPAGPASAATVSLDLYAVSGSMSLPVPAGSTTVNVLGYNTSNSPVTTPGGPTLTVAQGDDVTITLHNQLSEQSGLLINGQGMIPDLSGVAAGGTKNYTFTAERPGTYLYEASLLPNAQHQVAMGLYGALVVTPTAGTGQAYADASTAFDDSFVMLLSEIDPILNNAANPAAFDMRKYHPRYFLINGQVYPDIAPFETNGNSNVLLRYVNAGVDYHSLGVLGARQDVIALDGNPLEFSREYVAETFGPGQTADAIVRAPSSDQDAFLSLYDANLSFHNTNTVGIGGMLTALHAVADTASPGDHFGPATRDVALALNGTLTATIDDTANGGSAVTEAEYYIDDVTGGTGTPMTGTFGSPTANVTASSVTVPSGDHVVYVRGRDANTWGPFSSVLVNGGDAGGPTTSGVVLTPAITNNLRTTGIDVTATADDRTTGGSNIMDGEYSIGATAASAGTGTQMLPNLDAPVASLDATIPNTVINGLPEGNNSVWVRSRDAQGNWGDAEFANLIMDKTAPTTAGVTVDPTPNNGTLPVNPGWPFVRVTASVTDPLGGDVNSAIKGAELFIDTVGANGTGIGMVALDGVFNSTSETAYADIPLATVQQLSNGSHTMYVHAKDVAGNWGLTATGTLVVDKAAPTVSAVSASPNPTAGATTVALTATGNDAGTSVTRAEWFIGTDPGYGNANAMTVSGAGPWNLAATVNVGAMSEGMYTVKVRAKDAAGNWGATASTVLTVSHPLFYSTLGNTNPPGVTGTADDSDIYNWDGAAHSRAIDMSTAPRSVATGANLDGYDRVTPTTFYASFTGNVTLTGITGTVQDDDVVFFNGSTWVMYFDASTHGFPTNNGNYDLDAISIGGGSLYFSTVGNVNPPGVTGAADDADIYRWNGGSSYTRVWDASANGLAAAADVDGLVWVDATHLFLSFNANNTAVPGLGNQQDEDVVYDNGGSWSTYFDGTAHGLGTSGNLDIDAFDLP